MTRKDVLCATLHLIVIVGVEAIKNTLSNQIVGLSGAKELDRGGVDEPELEVLNDRDGIRR